MLIRSCPKPLLACALCASAGLAAARTMLIDVRAPEEYAAGHLEGALNIRHTEIGQRIGSVGAQRDDQIIIYCRTGARSYDAGRTLTRMGYRHVFDYGAMEKASQRLKTGK